MTPTFSIIIPHHNIPRLLERCLASIPMRDDLEVIVVDDNSDPAIVDFDNFPGHDRKDVKIIFSKEGKWAGAARNKGIEAATGKWLLFADADDFFNYCLSDMLDKYASSDADIVFFRANSLDSELYCASAQTERRTRHINRYFHKYFSGDPEGELLLRYAWGEPWAKLYRSQMVRDHSIRFDAAPRNNDTTFTYLSGYHARTIAVDPHCLYCVTYRPGSLSLTVSDAKTLAAVDIFSRKEKFIKEIGVKYKDGIDAMHYVSIAEAWNASRPLYTQALEVAHKSLPDNLHFRLMTRFFILKRIVKNIIGWNNRK